MLTPAQAAAARVRIARERVRDAAPRREVWLWPVFVAGVVVLFAVAVVTGEG